MQLDLLLASSTGRPVYVRFAHFHSVLKYGIIFGGSAPNSKKILTLQKNVRLMAGVKPIILSVSLFNR
jgi:hypothetical protein